MLGSLVNLGQRVCALVNDLAPKERTAEQPSLRWRGSRGGRRSKTLSRAPRMVKASVTFHGESVVELSRQSLNSVPSSWGSSRSLAVPRRWTPVHFSPLSPGVPWSKYHSFETVQSLPATPVPPSSPTFSEPPLPFLAPNTDAYDDQRCGTPGECVISSTCNGRPFRLRPFAQSSTADGKGCFKPTYGLEAIREGIESRSYFNNIDLAPNAVGPQAPNAQGRTKWAPMEPKERTSQTEPVKTAVPQNPWHNGSAYPVGNAAEAPRSRSWSNPGADSHHPSSDDIQLSANLNFQKPFSCSTRDMASDCYGASSTNASHDFFKPYLRGPMFKATARTGQPAVWSPKTRAPAGSTGLSGGRAPAQEAHLAPLAQANSGVSRSQPTGAWPGDVLPSEIQRGGAQLLPWELPTEPSVSSSAAAGPVQEGAPPPPPPPPMGQNTAGAFVGQEATKQTALPNESNAEGRSTVVIPETESVASLRSKIQSQLTMARPKQRFQQAQVEVTDERSWPAPAEPTGSIKDRAKELELKRLASAGRPVTEEEQPVQVRTEEHAFSRLRSPTPQALNHGPTSLTSNESSCRTPMLSDFRSPSPPTIPPTPVELLSPTSRSDLPSYGNYAGVGRFPSDSWASRTLNRAPARQTFQTSTIQRNTSKQERRPSKDYQHQWYKMMFKKLHQIDKNEDSAVMHYRIRDHLGEKPVRDKSPSQRPQQSHANERSRQFLSPEPAPPDTAMTYRYNRSKSVGRSSSPASSAAALSLPTDAKHSSNAAVGFRHQPRRIEDYTPGHSSIIEDAIAAKASSGSASENQTSIQAMLDNSQGLIQRILGDLSREVEQHKMALQNYSDIDFWLVDNSHSAKRCGKADAATQVVRPAESSHSAVDRLSVLATPPRNRGAPRRGRLSSWSHPVRCHDPGSRLYALERSKTMTFHLPPFRVQTEADARDKRLLHCITEAWERNSAELTAITERSDKAVQSDMSATVLQRRRNPTAEKEAAYDKLFEELAKAVEDIERMAVAETSSSTARSEYRSRRRSRSLEDTNGSEGPSFGPLRSGSTFKPSRHSISSCSVPFCPFCSVRNGRPGSSCTSFGSDSFYFATNVDSASDVSCSADTNTECLTYRPAVNICDTGSSMTQRQKHQVPRCKSALDHPRNFNVGASEAHARKSELSRIADHDRISVEQRKADSVGNYGRPVLARVLYSFVSQNPRELDLYPDDTVTIRRQIDANWCEGEVDGRVGIFPTNYVEPYTEKSTNDTRGTAGARRGRSMAKVLYDFVARRPRELTIKQGEVVHLIREVDRNWSLGCNEHGQEGIFPSHYVRPCDGMAERKPVDTLTQRKGYQSHLGHPGFASAFDGHSTFGSRSTDRVSKLMIDGVSYGSGAKADSLDAILNEMKLYSSSLLDSKSSKPLPKQPPSVGMTANHNLPYASKIDTYEAVYDYMPENPDELELKRGDIVYVVESYDDGWFIGTSLRTGRFGMFPGNYVKRL
uniref:SH3 domain-containing protein n=1 Tax=Trichuris muris TaxID=70415 RepID=A0A5S6QVR9_TRIMR